MPVPTLTTVNFFDSLVSSGKQRVKAPDEPSGVRGDSARVKISRGTWETQGRDDEIEFSSPVKGVINAGRESITARPV